MPDEPEVKILTMAVNPLKVDEPDPGDTFSSPYTTNGTYGDGTGFPTGVSYQVRATMTATGGAGAGSGFGPVSSTGVWSFNLTGVTKGTNPHTIAYTVYKMTPPPMGIADGSASVSVTIPPPPPPPMPPPPPPPGP